MPLNNDAATPPRAQRNPSVARVRSKGIRVRSRWLVSLLAPLRRAWQRGWGLMPDAWRPLRVRMALALRGVIGLPVERSTGFLSGWSYWHWVETHDTLSDADRVAIRRHLTELGASPLISVVMPVYETEEVHLREAIASVRAQLYPHWELCIADDASMQPHVGRVLAEVAEADPRIRFVTRARNGHISAATNTALSLATGDYVALMDHDDILAEHALYEVAVEIARHPDAAVIYSDEDKIDDGGLRWDPCFKPDFDPDRLLAQNLISHLGVYRRDLLERVGGLREGFEGSQDHDLALRATAACGAARVRHIPAVLYHWRQAQRGGSFSQTSLRRCALASRRAVAEHLASQGVTATLGWAPLAPQYLRITWPLPQPAPLVSAIVPTRDRADLLRVCAEGVLGRTDYKNLELIVMDNGSVEPETQALFGELLRDPRVRVIAAPGPFNYSAINNHAAREARGEILLLLNNDVEVMDPGWLHEMVSQVMRPGVGAVGAKLLYPDDTVQHGGVVLGVGGVAGHFGLGLDRDDPGPFGILGLVRQVSAVTAACLAVPRGVYEAAGGLDEQNLTVAFNDVDLCIRIGELGFRILWTPFAELYHHESVSRGFDTRGEKAARFAREVAFMQHRWRTALDEDPFYNPNLDSGAAAGIAGKPRRTPPWRAVEPGRRRAA